MMARTPATDSIREQLSHGREEVLELPAEVLGIIGDLRELMLQELDLAKAEAQEAAGSAVRTAALGAGALAAALLTGVFAGLTFLFGLYVVMPLWAAALVTTAVVGLLAALAASVAVEQFRQISLVPKRTVKSIREDVTWAKSQMTFSGRSGPAATS